MIRLFMFSILSLLSMIASAAALADDIAYSNLAKFLEDETFLRGQMEVKSRGTSISVSGTSRLINLYADGNGSASIEVYDNHDRLIGTVTGISKNVDIPDSEIPPVVVTLTLVTALGENDASCNTLLNEMVCTLYVTEPDPRAENSTGATIIANIRGRIDYAEILNNSFGGTGSAEIVADYESTVTKSSGPL